MRELRKQLMEAKDLLDFTNLHLKGMKFIVPVALIYHLTPNSNELMLYSALIYTIYWKFRQIQYEKKIINITKQIKQTALINLQKENKKKSNSKELVPTKTKSEYKYNYKENSPTIKTSTFNNIKTKKLTRKR